VDAQAARTPMNRDKLRCEPYLCSWGPVLGLFVQFARRNFGQRGAELQRTGGLLDLAAEFARGGQELGGAERAEIAFGQLGFDALQLSAEFIDPIAGGGEPLLAERFQFDSVEVLDIELMFSAQANERGFGDIELGSDTSEAPTFGAHFDEPRDCFCIYHSNPVFAPNWIDALRSDPVGLVNVLRERLRSRGFNQRYGLNEQERILMIRRKGGWIRMLRAKGGLSNRF
jgi:hypothetical protein